MDKSGCQYHSDCFTCPFEICVMEYPGGPKVYFAHKETIEALDNGMNLKEAAEALSVQPQAIRRRMKKVSVGIR